MRAFKDPWWVVFGSTLGLIVGNGPITLFTFGVFLKPIVAEFGWHRATVAAAITTSQLVGAICTPFVGRLVDRWGVRRVTLPFILAFAIATAAISLAPASPTAFILLYGIAGLAGAGQSPLNYAKAISAWFENRRGLALGIAMSGVGIGVALMPQLARVLINSFGWRGGYVGLGIATLAVGFPAVALFVREPRDYSSEANVVIKQALPLLEGMTPGEAARGTFQFWFVLVATSLVALSVNGTITHIVPILTDRGISVRLATSLLSVSGIALIGGRIVSGYFSGLFLCALRCSVFLSIAGGGYRFAEHRRRNGRASGGYRLPWDWHRLRNRHDRFLGRQVFRRSKFRRNLRLHYGGIFVQLRFRPGSHGFLFRLEAFLQFRTFGIRRVARGRESAHLASWSL